MVDVALPSGFSGTEKLPKTRTNLVNCWNAGDKIIGRWGIRELNTTGLVARGQFVWNDSLYQVVSTSLIRILDETLGTFSTIGTIAGTEDIDFAIGFNHAVIISKGGNGYTLDSSDTLTQIVSVNFKSSDSVTHINGRFVYIPTDGSPAFFSDVGDGATIQATSFFDAEELPDDNEVAVNLNNVLYIGGTDSFEKFRDVNFSPLLPYARLNARVSFGYIGGIQEYADTIVFIGREKDQDVGVYAISGGSAQKISNELVDTRLINYTPTQLSNAKTNRVKWLGYDIFTLKLPNDAFGFYNGNWFELTTQVGNEAKPWNADYITHFNLKYYVAHANKIGVFEDVPTDYGNTFEKRIDVGFQEERAFTIGSVELGISQGFNAAIGSMALQLSDDNVLYSPPFYRQTGAIGQYDQLLEWSYPGGLGYYPSKFAGLRFTSTENINGSIGHLTVNI